jgi:hypothetical protein
MHVTTVVGALIALAGALVVIRWMPGSRASAPVPVPAETESSEMAGEPAGVEG